MMRADGSVIAQSATMDIGPGTGTAMTRIATRVLGVSPKKVRFDLGHSSLPDAPGQNGSSTIPSVGSASACGLYLIKTEAGGIGRWDVGGFQVRRPGGRPETDGYMHLPGTRPESPMPIFLNTTNLPSLM